MKTTMHDRDGVIWLDGEPVPWRDAQLHFLTHSLRDGMAHIDSAFNAEAERDLNKPVRRCGLHSKSAAQAERFH